MRVGYLVFFLALLAPAFVASAAEVTELRGKPPTALGLNDLGGKGRSLQELLGSVVMVNFWTSWCPPCVAELSVLERLGRDLDDQPFEILAVNVAEPRGSVTRFGQFGGKRMHILMDSDGQQAKQWGVRFFPTSFVVDASGQLAYRVLGEADWYSDGLLDLVRRLLPDRPTD